MGQNKKKVELLQKTDSILITYD